MSDKQQIIQENKSGPIDDVIVSVLQSMDR